MDAIIGKYRVHTEERCIILKHPTGISFELEPEEALGFADLINTYRQTLTTLEPTTEKVTRITPASNKQSNIPTEGIS